MATIGDRPHLFCFGFGFSALALARILHSEGWRISGTCRSEDKQAQPASAGYLVHRFDREQPLVNPGQCLEGVTDILSSIPPDEQGDPVLDLCGDAIRSQRRLRWVGYLSTTGVYGDTGGRLVDETAPPCPTSKRSQRRVAAEHRWLLLHREKKVPVHIFRLAGIYGPSRSAIDSARAGNVRRILKPEHLFSRIHVDDIALIVRASMARPDPGRIYNVCDDLPAEQSEVVTFACELLGIEPPPAIPFEQAIETLSPMARSFWNDNRRIDNTRIKEELGIALRYPDFRTGLKAVLEATTADPLTDRGRSVDEG
ncbi:MAG: SDR family oxidoreductase [Rhodospirillales bacterium]|nr:SDR family oxidoreductase [Rhodospirillales bacterium]